MHNNLILQSNFKRRRKYRVNLKPVNPVRLNAAPLTKIVRDILNCFKRKQTKIMHIDENIQLKQYGTPKKHNASSMTPPNKEHRDLSPLFREITTNFFENQYHCLHNKTSKMIGKAKSESSFCSASNFSSKENSRRKRSKISKISKSESSSVIDLKSTKQCLSANAFLTTSFFSLSHAPEFSTYPIHVNLRYAEESSVAETNNKSSQYSERDFLEVNKHAKTSTRGLLNFSDNFTQSEKIDSNEYLEHSITHKIAHFYQITPIQGNKSELKVSDTDIVNDMQKVSKLTNMLHSDIDQPKILYTNNTKPFVSTDDSTMESKIDSDDYNIKDKFKRRKLLKPAQPVLTKNCFTSTSDTCICAEMCPKFKEWYESLQNNMKKQYPKFHCYNQIHSSGLSKIRTSNEKQEDMINAAKLLENISKKDTSKTDFNTEMDRKDAIRKLSEFLVDDMQTLTAESSLSQVEDLVSRKNLMDILNQRYPTFIGFQINNNESHKVRYSISKRIHSSNTKAKVPKIIIREKKKRKNSQKKVECESKYDTNLKENLTNSDTSIISVTAKSADVIEIRGIIENLLPKDPLKIKVMNTENFRQKSRVEQTKLNKAGDHLYDDQILMLEVEKIVDELLDEIPSTSKEFIERKSLSSQKTKRYNFTLNNQVSNAALADNIKSQPLKIIDPECANKLPSRTIASILHEIKLSDVKQQIITAQRTKYEADSNETINTELVADTIGPGNKNENNDGVKTLTVKSSVQTIIESVLSEENNIPIVNENETHTLNDGFYAQIIQKSVSTDPIIYSKISNSSTKASIHSFIKSLLLCLKYQDSKTTLQDVSVQSDNDYNLISNENDKMGNENPTVVATSYLNQPTIDIDLVCDEKKKKSILKKSNRTSKTDKANMMCQETNSVGIQVLVAAHVKDKQVSSPSLTRWKPRRSAKRDIATQTKVITKVDTSSNSSSMEYNINLYNQKQLLSYPSTNKKVSQVQTGEANIRILPEAMAQKINYHFKRSKQNTSTIFKQRNNLKAKWTKRLHNQARRTKSNYIIRPNTMSTNNSVLPKRKSTGSFGIQSDPSALTISSRPSLASKFKGQNECIYKNIYSDFKPLMHSDMGDGDVQNLISFRMFNYVKNTSCHVLYSLHDENHFSNGINKEGVVNKDGSHHSLTPLSPSSDKETSIQNAKSHIDPLLEQGDVVNEGDDSESDIYKFTSTDTAINDSYLERIRHIWLKSGLRQHFSHLSNIKLKPVDEPGELEKHSVAEPLPVLEKIDITPFELKTVTVDRKPPKESTTLAKFKSKEFEVESAYTGMNKVHPILFENLQNIEHERQYVIPISGSSETETDIEPSLANVGPTPEEPNPEFVKWLVSLGIPLRRISEHEVQTSVCNFKEQPVATESRATDTEEYDEVGCNCDNVKVVVKVPSTSDEDMQDYKITCLKDNILLTIPPEKFRLLQYLKKKLHKTVDTASTCLLDKKNKLKERNVRNGEKTSLEISSYDSVFEMKPGNKRNIQIKQCEKNIVPVSGSDTHQDCICNPEECTSIRTENGFQVKRRDTELDNLNRYQFKSDDLEKYKTQEGIEENILTSSHSEINEKEKEEKLKTTKNNNVQQHDTEAYVHKKIQSKRSLASGQQNNKNKHVGVRRQNKFSNNRNNNLQEKLLVPKKSNITFYPKRNLQESLMYIGDKIIDISNPPKLSIPVDKILGEKLYTACSKAEAEISKKLAMTSTCVPEKSKPRKNRTVRIVDNVQQHDKETYVHKKCKTKRSRVAAQNDNETKRINSKYVDVRRHNKFSNNITFYPNRNLQESLTYIGDKIIDISNPPKVSIPIEKILGEKLYSACAKAEAKISEKLGITSKCVPEFKTIIKKNHKQKLEVKIKSRNTNKNANSISTLPQIHTRNENYSGHDVSARKLRNGNVDERKKYSNTNTTSVLSAFSIKHEKFHPKEAKDRINNTIVKESSIDRSTSSHSWSNLSSDVESDTSFKESSYPSNRISEANSTCFSTKVKSFASFSNKLTEPYLDQCGIREPTLSYSNTCFEKYDMYSKTDVDVIMKPISNSLLSKGYDGCYAPFNSTNYKKGIEYDTLPKHVHDQQLSDRPQNIKFDTRTSLLFAIRSLAKLIAKFNIEHISSRNFNHQHKANVCKRTQKSKTDPDINTIFKNKLSDRKSYTIQSSPKICFRGGMYDSEISNETNTKQSKLSTQAVDRASIEYLYLNSNVTRKNKQLLSYDSLTSSTINEDILKNNAFSSDGSLSDSRSSIKGNLIRKSLDNFFADVLNSWEAYSSKNVTSNKYKRYISKISADDKRTQTRMSCEDDTFLLAEYKRISNPGLYSDALNCFNIVNEMSTTTLIQNSCELNFELSGNTSSCSSNVILEPDDENDIWEIIKLLSKLCPRVLCQYYIKKVLN